MPCLPIAAFAAVTRFFTDGLAGKAALDAVASHTVGVAAGSFGAAGLAVGVCDAKARLSSADVAAAHTRVVRLRLACGVPTAHGSVNTHDRAAEDVRIRPAGSRPRARLLPCRTRRRIRLLTSEVQDMIW